MAEPLNLCLMGASTDTGNLGVTALCLSIVGGIARRAPDASLTVFDNRRGDGHESASFAGQPFRFRRSGLHDSRRLYRPESLWNVRVASLLGWPENAAAQALRDADAVLDVTGGDSFTDLYGPRRFRSGCAAKRLALAHSGGLVLLPQTYGPFRGQRTQREAADVVAGAECAWARDAASFDVLRSLLGGAFDAERHRSGVDVAFRLEPAAPRLPLTPQLRRWLAPDRDAPVVGINVSGLTHVYPEQARRDYGLRADYRATIRGVLQRFLERSDARVVLVPHVLTPPGHFESDGEACRHAVATLGGRAFDRVAVAPDLDAAEAKWLIARTDWFSGTRMHSTIAALSSGVPAAALAYSGKTRGVFGTCGVAEHVADLRELGTDEAIAAVWRSWEARDEAAAALAQALPGVLAAADAQMDEIVATCRRMADRRRARLRVTG
jgi:colanic acid/amylovoran biosynthesis protein